MEGSLRMPILLLSCVALHRLVQDFIALYEDDALLIPTRDAVHASYVRHRRPRQPLRLP
jgi:hypothetical protein